MKENNIDKLFKDKLSDGNFAYQQGYWSGAEKLIAQQQVKAGGFLAGKGLLWIIAIPVIIGLGAVIWATSIQSDEQLPQNKSEQLIPLADQDQDETVDQTESAPSSFETNNDQNTSESISQNPITPTSPSKTTTQNDESSSTTNQTNSNLVNSVVNERPDQEVIAAVQESDPVKEAASPPPPEEAHPTVTVSQSEQSPQGVLAENTTSNVNQSGLEANSETTANKTSLTTESNDLQSEENANTVSTENNQVLEETADTYSPISEESSVSLAAKAEEDNAADATPIILPHQKNKTWLISAGVDYSYFFTNRTLTGDASNSAYVDFRNSYENAQNITSLGAHVLFERNKWLFSTGVYQTTINEDINYPSTLNVLTGVDNGQWNVQEIWNYSVDSNWVITGIYQGMWNYDTAWSLTYDSIYMEQWDSVYTQKEDPAVLANNGRHSMSYIEIPLLAGRSFGGEKLRFEIQAGGAVGILTGTQGSIYINPRLERLVASDAHINQFREWQFNVMLRAGLRYDVTPQIQATLFPVVRYSLLNALNAQAIDQRYLGYGLNIGLSYRF